MPTWEEQRGSVVADLVILRRGVRGDDYTNEIKAMIRLS